MIKNIILIPGLNGKFDSFSFNVIINWALKHNIPLSKLTFSKYKTSEKFSSTFKEQIKELEDQIKDDGKDFLIVAKSLGCIPALLCQSKANKLLVSPPVIITQTNEKLLEMKFSDMLTNPIEIGEEKFKNSSNLRFASWNFKKQEIF